MRLIPKSRRRRNELDGLWALTARGLTRHQPTGAPTSSGPPCVPCGMRERWPRTPHHKRIATSSLVILLLCVAALLPPPSATPFCVSYTTGVKSLSTDPSTTVRIVTPIRRRLVGIPLRWSKRVSSISDQPRWFNDTDYGQVSTLIRAPIDLNVRFSSTLIARRCATFLSFNGIVLSLCLFNRIICKTEGSKRKKPSVFTVHTKTWLFVSPRNVLKTSVSDTFSYYLIHTYKYTNIQNVRIKLYLIIIKK